MERAMSNDKTLRLPNRPNNRPMPSTRSGARWSHQDELSALRGREFAYSLKSDPLEFYAAKLIDADQFSLKIEIHDGIVGAKVVTLFKHVLGGYYVV
jgi:hypothetical protein